MYIDFISKRCYTDLQADDYFVIMVQLNVCGCFKIQNSPKSCVNVEAWDGRITLTTSVHEQTQSN